VANILLLHQGVYGHTRRICERLQTELASHGHAADVAALDQAPDLARYDSIVIGASIRHGKHNPAVMEFIRQHQSIIESRPSAFFSVSLVARKPARNTAQTNPYVKAFLAGCPWQPRLVGVFGGELDYQRYGAFDRMAIRFIMRLTGGPTDPGTKVVFTNWDEVERFADQIAALATTSGRAETMSA
jgi:menaquinone-dependent protoporphyrinogen oxidase